MNVPELEKCAGLLQRGLATVLCKPLEQPADCSNDSWKQLYGDNGVASFSDCEGSFLTLGGAEILPKPKKAKKSKLENLCTVFSPENVRYSV